MDERWLLPALTWLLYLPTMVRDVRARRTPPVGRPRSPSLLATWAWPAVLAAWLVGTGRAGWWTWASVGVRPDDLVTSAFLGVVAHGLFLLVLEDVFARAALRRGPDAVRATWRRHVRLLRGQWPRTVPGRRRVALRGLASAALTGWAIQGVLVHHVATLSGSAVAGLALGASALVPHALRFGRREAVFAAATFLAAAALVLSPLGLVGAMAFLVAGAVQWSRLGMQFEHLRGFRAWYARQVATARAPGP